MKKVNLYNLGLTDYTKAWEFQETLFRESIRKKTENRNLPLALQYYIENHFIICSHPPVITLGTGGDKKNLLFSTEHLEKIGIQFIKSNRGGDITYHGPGQVVGYPILDLDQWTTDIHAYMEKLEEVIILTLNDYGIKGRRIKGLTGVWLDADNPQKTRKICAMGVRTSRWVTMHGFALNVNTKLEHFNYIIPCGINDKQVTSISKELNKVIDENDVIQTVSKYFENLFDVRLVLQHT
jgi:lipoyl(octanoyl) transferase